MSKATELVSARRFHAQALSYAREQAPERAGAAGSAGIPSSTPHGS